VVKKGIVKFSTVVIVFILALSAVQKLQVAVENRKEMGKIEAEIAQLKSVAAQGMVSLVLTVLLEVDEALRKAGTVNSSVVWRIIDGLLTKYNSSSKVYEFREGRCGVNVTYIKLLFGEESSCEEVKLLLNPYGGFLEGAMNFKVELQVKAEVGDGRYIKRSSIVFHHRARVLRMLELSRTLYEKINEELSAGECSESKVRKLFERVLSEAPIDPFKVSIILLEISEERVSFEVVIREEGALGILGCAGDLVVSEKFLARLTPARGVS